MDLRAKLALHQNQKKPNSEPVYEPLTSEYTLASLLPGKTIQCELGEYFCVEYRYPLSHFHGKLHLGALAREELAAIAGLLKDPQLRCPHGLSDLVFMDTETTGLAGGTGTYAFMVGIGYFTEDAFVLNQYMMEDYHQESAMLDEVYRQIRARSHLITFNGKTFDWPLLEGRFTYHRMREKFSPVHVDLLHPARRYYKQRLETCRLAALEDAILGFGRQEDISGAEVPALFFRYLEEKDGRIIAPVFQHNHWDILTLVTLLTHLLQAFQVPDEVLDQPEDLFSAGKIHEDLGQFEQAINCYRQSLALTEVPQLRGDILMRLSYLFKRMGRLEEACAIWEKFVNSRSSVRLFPYLELAKHFEHHLKDYEKAIQITEAAKELLLSQRRFYSAPKFKEMLGELQHREERLQKKCGKTLENSCRLEIEQG